MPEDHNEDYGLDIDVPDVGTDFESEYTQAPFLYMVPESVGPVVNGLLDGGYQEDEAAAEETGTNWRELERFRARAEALANVRYGSPF